jgi:hypothetical protein
VAAVSNVDLIHDDPTSGRKSVQYLTLATRQRETQFLSMPGSSTSLDALENQPSSSS